MSAKGEAARRSVRGLLWTDSACIVLDVRRGAETTVRQNRQHRDRATKVVGNQQKFSGRMNARVGGTCSAGRDGIKERQVSITSIDRKSADRAFFGFADSICFIGGIQSSAGGIQSEAVRTGARFVNARWRQDAGRTIHFKEMNAPTVPRRQIHLGRQDIAQRGTEGSNI